MKSESDRTERLGLVAIGSSRCWDISVDESLDGEWSMEIDGPEIYLVFQLRDRKVISEALGFLQSGPGAKRHTDRQSGDAEGVVSLGRFGPASVSLMWDNEDFQRCFFVVGPQAGFTLRLALGVDDIQMVSEALRQVVKELP